MTTTKKILIAFSLIAVLAGLFYFAQPAKAQDTVQILMDKIASLRAKIAELEQELFNLQNRPIQIISDIQLNSISGPTHLAVNQTGTWTIKATSSNNSSLTYFVDWGDQWIAPSRNSGFPLSQTATFTHAYAAAGTYTIRFTVTDNWGHSASGTTIVTVGTQSNTAPTANSQSTSTNQNSPILITLTGSDPQGSQLTFIIASNPMHGTISGISFMSNNSARVTYTPHINFSGFDSFTFKVSDGVHMSNVATVSIWINPFPPPPPLNIPPVINSISGPNSLAVNQTGTWRVTATDTPGDTLTYSVNWGDEQILPLELRAQSELNQSQSATFTHIYSVAGNYTITFTVTDSQGQSATRTTFISVGLPHNFPPTAHNQSITVNQNSSVNVTLTGSDPENLPLNFMIVSHPTHGILSGITFMSNNSARVTYTPHINFSGFDSFTFKVSDGINMSNVAVVSIRVNPFPPPPPPNVPPVINSISGPVSLAVGQIGTWTIRVTATNSSSLTYFVDWGDQWMPVFDNGFRLGQTATFTHAYSMRGNFNVTIRVVDNTGALATSTISVNIR